MNNYDIMDLVRTLEGALYETRRDQKATNCIKDIIDTIKESYDLSECESCGKLHEKYHLVENGWAGFFCSNCAPALHAEAEKDQRDAEE